MKLSTRTRYGTRALLELALRHEDGPVSLKDIAREQQISLPYLEHLIAPLIAGGIIRSTKGPKGGITLARKPENIRLIEITELLEGPLAPVECIDKPEACKRSGDCATRDIWSELKGVMCGYLGSTTLQDLVDKQKSKSRPAAAMYSI
jgi:Rrf2 family transcriptional regulator, cysteine metabolism repressor